MWTRHRDGFARRARAASLGPIRPPEKNVARGDQHGRLGGFARGTSGMNAAALCRTLLLVGGLAAWAPGLRAAEPLVTNFGLGTVLHPLQEPDVIALPQW